jgi:hypothetical protein
MLLLDREQLARHGADIQNKSLLGAPVQNRHAGVLVVPRGQIPVRFWSAPLHENGRELQKRHEYS